MYGRNVLAVVFAAAMFLMWGAAFAQERKVYEPTWESLDQHQTPEWFMDAKVGIFIYGPSPTREEFARVRPDYPFPPTDSWDIIAWDPDDIAERCVQSGVRYIVFGADPYTHWLLWRSKYAYVEGSDWRYLHGEYGGNKDYVAELQTAAKKRGLRFGLYRNVVRADRDPFWLPTMKEMIDRYHPDTIWLDGDKLSAPADVLKTKELAAYYYNNVPRPDEVAIEDAMGTYKHATWGKSLAHGDFYRKEMGPPHSNISDGYFERYETLYRWRTRRPVGPSQGLVDNLIEWMVDAVAKNGNFLPTIHLGPPRLMPMKWRTMRQIGMWLETNGEAIYETRPWYDGKPEGVTDAGIDVRYTVKGDALYAIMFDWPGRPPTLLHLKAAEGTTCHMLGVEESELAWKQTDKGLQINLPPGSGGSGFETEVPCDHAFTYRITPIPQWMSNQ